MRNSHPEILFVCALLAGGCVSLPEGEPPSGPVVEINAPSPGGAVSPESASNHLTTSFLAKCDRVFKSSPGKKVYCERAGDFSSQGMSSAAADFESGLAEEGLFTPATKASDADFILRSHISGGGDSFLWTAVLLRQKDGAELWSEQITVRK